MPSVVFLELVVGKTQFMQITNHASLTIHENRSSPRLGKSPKIMTEGTEGGEGSLIWPKRVCAAEQCMVLRVFLKS